MNNDALDPTIPVLTEIIGRKDFDGVASAQEPSSPLLSTEQDESSAAHATTEPVVQVDILNAPLLAGSEAQWDALEHKISERVLRQLQNRIDFVLEHRIADGLADAVQQAVEAMTAEIRRGLHHTLEDVITRAVSQEIAHLQTTRKRPASESGTDAD